MKNTIKNNSKSVNKKSVVIYGAEIVSRFKVIFVSHLLTTYSQTKKKEVNELVDCSDGLFQAGKGSENLRKMNDINQYGFSD